MTTQIIRDTFGVITTGKFCLFGGSKSKPKQVSCDNATIDMQFSIAINASKLTELTQTEMDEFVEEFIYSATVTHSGGISPFPDFYTLETVYIFEMMDWSYDQLPEGFTLLQSMLTSISNITTTSQTFKFKIEDKFKGLAMFVTPEQGNPSIINNGIEMSFCLAPQEPPAPPQPT